jgi:6-phosphogluconate dehydrogenase
MVLRLLRDGHECVAFDIDRGKVDRLVDAGARAAYSLREAVSLLDAPRSLWIMLPAGEQTVRTIESLAELLGADDLVVDGGNSHYHDDASRAALLGERGIRYLDAGLSGGVWGLEHGYSIMIGGRRDDVERLEPVFRSLAASAERGWAHVGPTGAGHYVKMIHNGMIYGLLQAYAEGFELLRNKKEYGLDLHGIAELWRYSSVARSWLLDLISMALKDDQSLEDVAAHIADSGEGRWTVQEAVEQGCPIPVISSSLLRRFRSQQDESYSDKLIAKLRNLFGGHELPKQDG